MRTRLWLETSTASRPCLVRRCGCRGRIDRVGAPIHRSRRADEWDYDLRSHLDAADIRARELLQDTDDRLYYEIDNVGT